MRGFAGVDLLVLDEAMIISEAAHSAAMPIIRASKAKRGPQLWYCGSAVDQDMHDYGVVWTRVRERGIQRDDPALAYFEWSVEADHPDDVTDEMMVDEELWKKVNFAIVRGRVTVEHMEWERRAMSQRGFAVELLGAGDYPPTDASADVLVQMEDWLALVDEKSVLQDPVCLRFDVSPDRQTAICAAGLERARQAACGGGGGRGRHGLGGGTVGGSVREVGCGRDRLRWLWAVGGDRPEGRRGGDHGEASGLAGVRDRVRPVRRRDR